MFLPCPYAILMSIVITLLDKKSIDYGNMFVIAVVSLPRQDGI